MGIPRAGNTVPAPRWQGGSRLAQQGDALQLDSFRNIRAYLVGLSITDRGRAMRVIAFAYGAKEANQGFIYRPAYIGEGRDVEAANKAHRRGYVTQIEINRMGQGE